MFGVALVVAAYDAPAARPWRQVHRVGGLSSHLISKGPPLSKIASQTFTLPTCLERPKLH